MTDETVSKEPEFALVPVGATLTKHSKPTLIQIGTRWVASDGRWHPEMAADYIVGHGGLDRWIPIGELARVFFLAGTPSNKSRIRQRMHKVFGAMFRKGLLLVVEYGDRSAAQACKIYNATSEVERQCIDSRLARMERLKTLRVAQLEQAYRLRAHADAEAQSSP